MKSNSINHIIHHNNHQAKKCYFSQLENKILKSIFGYLNILDLTIFTRVCSKWRRIIIKEDDMIVNIDMTIMPKKTQILNFIKIISRSSHLQELKLSETLSSTDTLTFLMALPPSLKSLKIPNLTFEFANVFRNICLPNVIKLDLDYKIRRKKLFDDTEAKSLTSCFCNLKSLSLNNAPINNDVTIILVSKLDKLEELSILKCENLDDSTLNAIGKYVPNLKKLHIGGSPKDYNMKYSYYGFEGLLLHGKIKLECITIEYCTKLGDDTIELISNTCTDTLREFRLTRNAYEKCTKVSDKAMNSLKKCWNIKKLSFEFVRKFSDEFPLHLSKLKNLRYLNLTDCPILEDLSILNEGCPLLEEINMSGDSWVRKVAVLGLSKHKNIKIFHLGHLEHSDVQCDKGLGEYPPKGVFIESLFKKPEAFSTLRVLYLEQICGLTYWLDIRIKKIRPYLNIKYTFLPNDLKLQIQK